MFRFLASQVAGLIRSRKKLAVIIPYRDRDAHLKELLPELEDLLLRSSIDFSICVVEQANDLPFNKGILLNVGFLESSSCDYFCFHDVDMIPLRADYSYVRSPTHLASNVEQFGWGIPYAGYFGGVVLFDKKSFNDINGYSNSYWGWGSEDDDLKQRCRNRRIPVRRRRGVYRSLPHDRCIIEGLYAQNRRQFAEAATDLHRQDTDGLRQVRYRIASRSRISRFAVHLHVEFDSKHEPIAFGVPSIEQLRSDAIDCPA